MITSNTPSASATARRSPPCPPASVGVDVERDLDAVEAVADVPVDAEDALQVHVPSNVAVTERSCTPRLGDRRDAGHQAGGEGGEHELGRVAPLSSEAKISGWSPSSVYFAVRVLLAEAGEAVDVVRLWVPFTHSHEARHWNFAASGVGQRLSGAEDRLDVHAIVDGGFPLRTLVNLSCWAPTR